MRKMIKDIRDIVVTAFLSVCAMVLIAVAVVELSRVVW